MRYILPLVLSCVTVVSLQAQVGGGPDKGGYYWISSDSVGGGVSYQWIDITATGTKVTGLADDNFVGPIPIGFDFPYYWGTYDRIYIGSNGYITFVAQGVNPMIASGANGFNDFPFSGDGGRNNLIAPLLSDLTFTDNNGDPIAGAEVYYETRGDTFIVSFINVPFWNNNAVGYSAGRSTFQIILNRADSTITINYQQVQCCVDAAYNGTNFISMGMEDISGTVGLDFNNTPGYPPPNYTIKVFRTDTVSYTFVDYVANWNYDSLGRGLFVLVNQKKEVKVNTANMGNIDMPPDDSIEVQIRLLRPNNATVSGSVRSYVLRGLKSQQDTTVIVTDYFGVSSPGFYRLRQSVTQLTTQGELTTTNNRIENEVVVVPLRSDSTMVLTFDNGNFDIQNENDGFMGLNAGVYIQPPVYRVRLDSVILTYYTVGNVNNRSDLIIKIYKDDGPPGQGTLIDSIVLAAPDLLSNVTVLFSFLNQGGDSTYICRRVVPVNNKALLASPGEGIYISVIAADPTKVGGITTDGRPPFSRNTYEIIAGVWAPYRASGMEDFAIGAIMKIDTLVSTTKPITLKNTYKLYPNPATHYTNLYYVLNKAGKVTITIFDQQGKKVFQEQLQQPQGEQLYRLDLSSFPAGLYYYRIQTPEHTYSGKFIVFEQ